MILIERAADCSIRTFMGCKFDNRLKLLIVEGQPSDEELAKAWDAIETEYNDLCGNKPAELVQIDKVNRLIARNEQVKGYFFCVDEVLRLAGAPYLDILPRLKKCGINIKWNNDIDNFKKQVEREKVREKSKHVELMDAKADLEKIQSSVTSSAQYSRKDFVRLKQAIQALGLVVSDTETNMFEFGVMVFDYLKLLSTQGAN